MKSLSHYKIIIISLLILALASITFKSIKLYDLIGQFLPEERFQITYEYYLKAKDNATKVKAYLPKNSERQKITSRQHFNQNAVFRKESEGQNIRGIWEIINTKIYNKIEYTFDFQGKEKQYIFSNHFESISAEYCDYLAETDYIQVNHPKIVALAKQISTDKDSDKQIINSVYTYVSQIPNAPIITLTDAVSALENQLASCNGKSRLFVGLARQLGYASRIKGGLILSTENSRQSHVWVEVLINGIWIPFDTVNKHYAYIPANYLELYESDQFLLTHTSDISFDYNYKIEEQINIPFIDASSDDINALIPFSLLKLLHNDILSYKTLLLLLLLPLGGFMVALLRNVVGLKTFGVFLPVLIAFALLKTGFVLGISIFLFLIFVIGFISQPFSKLGLLHTPKLVISLTLMVLIIICGSYLGVLTNNAWLGALSFFPIIILTISAERFSTYILEDGFWKATNMLIQTLIAVSICFLFLSSKILASVLIIFPEILVIIIVLSMLLGRYIGLRWSELIRFSPILNLKAI